MSTEPLTAEKIAMHTPGPWVLETVPTSIGTCHKIGPFPTNSGAHIENYACVYADNIRMNDYGFSKTGDELLANAKLIAAAPDLLAACKAALGAFEHNHAINWDDLQAAIDKAEGRA